MSQKLESRIIFMIETVYEKLSTFYQLEIIFYA